MCRWRFGITTQPKRDERDGHRVAVVDSDVVPSRRGRPLLAATSSQRIAISYEHPARRDGGGHLPND